MTQFTNDVLYKSSAVNGIKHEYLPHLLPIVTDVLLEGIN